MNLLMMVQNYCPKESSLRTRRVGTIVLVSILLVLWFGNFDTPTTCRWVGGGGGGGGGAYFIKKIDLSVFIPQLSSSFIC